MNKITTSIGAVALVLSGIGTSSAVVPVDLYEVWDCGDFNMQGYQSFDTIQFYPFGSKLANLDKIERRGGASIFAFNQVDGRRYGYLARRRDGAPITWIIHEPGTGVVNSSVIFESCSYSADPVD
jgi:hypothetical protein